MSKQSELDRWCVAFLDGDMSAGQFKRVVANLVTRQSNKQIEAELEALREEVKHEDLRTISQVITARIDKLKESK